MRKNRFYRFMMLIIYSLLLSACQNFSLSQQHYIVKFNSEGWEAVESLPIPILPLNIPLQSLDAGYSVVFLPPLIGRPDPKKEKVIITYKSNNPKSLDQTLQSLFNVIQEYCKSSSHEILVRNTNDVSVYATANGCKYSPYNQYSFILKIFNRLDGQYSIRYEFAPSEISKDKIANMKQVIMSATLAEATSQKQPAR